MTERKPPGASWESWIDKQIREAMERGDFDDLPGKGKPLPDIDRPRDDMWWVRRKLRDEDITVLPPSLQVRNDLDDARRRIAACDDESTVRTIVADINEKIREVNRSVVSGPPTTLMPLDVEVVVERWRAERTDRTG